jgi:MFS family permease
MPSDHNLDLPFSDKRPGALTFAALFAGESLLRAMNVTVIPLQAFELLGSSQKVSTIATAVSMLVLCTTLVLPVLFRNLRRRWAYSMGIIAVCAAALLFASYTVAGQIFGQYLRNAGTSILGVGLSLYIMDHVSKTQLTHSESLRLSLSTLSWTAGPVAGAWLCQHYGVWATHGAVLIVGALLMAGFWTVKLKDPALLPAGTLKGFSPLSNAIAFIRQPRLRLAWSIAFARSCFWSAMFIYCPVFLAEAGWSKSAAGLIVSISQLTLPFSLLYGRLARAYGVRPVVSLSFAGISVGAFSAGLIGFSHVFVVVGLLLFASLCATGLDGVGGIPFMRAVKPRQRREMTSVYRTYFELSELLPGVFFMGLLSFFGTPIVFIAVSLLAGFMCVLTWRHLPKSM